ncbi:hypothetical protein ACU4GA_24135 [Methylobacterium oryzae CBMB20]
MGDDLSPEEFGAAYCDLSRDDRKKLVVIAKRLCGGTTLNPGDLLNEAICRTLLGTRQCGRELNIVAYLVGVMRSLVSHERERRSGRSRPTTRRRSTPTCAPGLARSRGPVARRTPSSTPRRG